MSQALPSPHTLPHVLSGENCPLQLLASSFMAPCAPALLYFAPAQPSIDPHPQKENCHILQAI